MPELDNVMYNNYTDCTYMLFGPRSFYCITYKAGEVGFFIHTVKFNHTFYARIRDFNSSERKGCALDS